MQRVLSGQLASRRFLLHPPEPPPSLLLSSPSESVYIGRTKSLRAPFFWNPDKLINPHISVLGTTGSGKSYFVKTFITRARLALGCPSIVLDWAGEYGDWVRSAGGRVLSFGPEGINLLEPAGSSPHTRAKQVISCLEILTDISSYPRQRSLTQEAIEKAYLERGFSLSNAQMQPRKALPSLKDAYSLLSRNAKKDADSGQAAGRIRDLIISSGGSFVESTISIDSLFSGLVCVDLHSLPTESLRSLAGLTLLQLIKERMRASRRKKTRFPALFVVVDEAWKVASDERSDVVSIVREGRKYGFGLIVASQSPNDVHPSVFSNSGTIMCFRITSSEGRGYVRRSLAYSDYFEAESHSLSVGQALVHLEFSSPVSCPRTFMLSKVDGEEPLRQYFLGGDGMELGFERFELARHLASFGLSEQQAAAVLAKFEKKNYSADAVSFMLQLEGFGFSRPSAIAFLKKLGASELETLSVVSSLSKRREDEGKMAIIAISNDRPKERKASHPRKK